MALSIGIPLLLIVVGMSIIDFKSLKWPSKSSFIATGSSIISPAEPNFRKIDTDSPHVIPAKIPDSSTSDIQIGEVDTSQISINQSLSSEPVRAVDARDNEGSQPLTVGKAKQSSELSQPQIIGQVVIMRHETLYNLIENIYGDYSSKHFRSLILANPQIEDPDVVNVGQVIQMPAIPIDIRPPVASAWWVSVVRAKSLDEAYEFLRSLPKGFPPIKILCYWTPEKGMHYDLVLNRYFTSSESAQIIKRQLPVSQFPNSQVVSIWSKDKIFYSNPFFVSSNRQQKG
jgi:hypothetical protein